MSLRPGRLLWLVCLCFCSVMFFPTAFSTTAHASGTPITVTSETDSVHFPTSIDFGVRVVDTADPITQATFYITYYDQSGALPTSRNVQIAHPGKVLTLLWHEDTGNSNTFHEAGTPVVYSWNFQDSAGNQYAGAPLKFTMIDSRFAWQQKTQGLLQVDWYNRPSSFGNTLMQNASNALTHITSVLGSGLLHPITIWVYASDSDFHGALAPNSYEWVGGEALPALNEALISAVDANDTTLIRDLPHEMTHLVFHQLTADGPIAPTWFDEGLAVYNQLYHEPEMQARFQQALGSDSLLRLSDISDGFPANADTAYLAYAQSWNLVSYMYSTFGQAKMGQLIKNMDTYQLDFDEALTNALGMDEVHLENKWRLSLNQSSVLPTTQTTPTPVTTPTTQTASGSDILTPLLITAGVLLVVLPLIALLWIFFYQRRKKRAPVADATALTGYRNGMPTPVMGSRAAAWPQSPNHTTPVPYTHPTAYMPMTPVTPQPQQARSTYIPMQYDMPQQEQPGLNRHVQATNSPDTLWYLEDYPVNEDDTDKQKAVTWETTSGQYQERVNQSPKKPAPQE